MSDSRSSRSHSGRSRNGISRARGLALAVIIVVLTVSLLSTASVADQHGSVAVEQNGVCQVVDPVSTNEDPVAFYDYSGGETPYSSLGTVQYQADDTSVLMFHDGPEGLSLVILQDRYPGPNGDGGTDGGVASFDVSGLPAEGSWTVEDDNYNGQDDQFRHDGSESELDWAWTTGRNDGAVFTGLEPGSTIRIDPAFNEAARLDPDEGTGQEGVISSWQVIDNSDSGFERRSLSNLNDPVYIWVGSCADPPAPETTLDVTPNVTSVGDAVTMDASATESVRPITEYRWDFNGDGTIDATTQSPTTQHSFNSSGTFNVSVTAVNDANATDTASASVVVGAGDDPTAAVTAPDEATTGAAVTFDANNSSVDEPPASYEWFVDGTSVATTEDSRYDYTFDDSGTYTVEVVVSDSIGRSTTASTSVDVYDPLAANFTAPADVRFTGESLSFDAAASTGNITTYTWAFGDGNGTETTDPSAEHTYAAPGEYTVSLMVTDAGGETANATRQVELEAPRPTAAIDGPTSLGAGATAEFDASDSTAAEGELTYSWQIDGEPVGNASDSTLETPFNESGTYTVTAIVTDGTNRSDTAELDVSVEPLEAVIDTDPESPEVNDTVTFSATDSTGVIDSYEWTLVGVADTDANESDANETTEDRTIEGSTATHVYRSAGTYEVVLQVRGPAGTANTTTTITVDAPANESADEEETGTDDGDESGSSGGGAPSSGGSSGGGAPSAGGSSGGGAPSSGSSGGAPSSGGSSGGGQAAQPSTPEPTEANITVTGVQAGTAVVDRPFDLTVSVENTGDLDGNETIPVTVDGDEQTTLSVTVPPGSTITETVSITVGDVGPVDIDVGSASTTAQVQPAEVDFRLTGVELEQSQIRAGENAVVFATVRNDGTVPGEFRAELAVAGSVSSVQSVEVMPGQTERIRLAQRFESPGTYTIAVGNETAEVTVEGAEPSATVTPATAESTQRADGFGMAVTLAALLLALVAALARTRR